MRQAAVVFDESAVELPTMQPSRRLSFFRFLKQYPIFLLAFGPPIFKPPLVGVDTSQAHFDIWNILQVGWLFLIALRAILRLTTARSILIPKQVRSILKYAFFLGFLFVASIVYSPGRAISAEYSVIYFLSLVCVVEFVVDVYQNPPNWMQGLFHLRLIALILFAVVLAMLPFRPALVLTTVPGAGIRLLGGAVAPVTVICPVIALVSAYSFLHSLESRVRSVLLFLIGLAGLAATQVRGAEIALFVSFGILGIGWAKTGRRASYIVISGFMASILLGGIFMGTIGGEHIWNTFNRGQDIAGIETASGRTGVWLDVIRYCMSNPQGMGYIAGIRASRRSEYATNLHALLTRMGGTDNSFMEVLADAGWLALALYLIMIAKTLALGWRYAKKEDVNRRDVDAGTRHAISCALLLFAFCLVEGMDSSVFTSPLSQGFYVQNIIVAIILGASASRIIASRSQRDSYPR